MNNIFKYNPLKNERGGLSDIWDSVIGIGGAIIGGVIGAVYGGPFGAVKGALWGYGLASVAEVLVTGFPSPDLPSLGDISATYNGPSPVDTIREGIPIARAYGKCQLAGNKVRTSDIETETNMMLILTHCAGPVSGVISYAVNDIDWDDLTDTHTYNFYTGTTSQLYDTRFIGDSLGAELIPDPSCATDFFDLQEAPWAHDAVGEEYDIDGTQASAVSMAEVISGVTRNHYYRIYATIGNYATGNMRFRIGGASTAWYGADEIITTDLFASGTTCDNKFFVEADADYDASLQYISLKDSTGRSSTYRGIAYSAFTFAKTAQIGWNPNITVVGDWQLCTPIGETTPGASDKVFSRNPATILYDWYMNVENYSYSEMDVVTFRELETFCNALVSGTSRYTFDYVFDTSITINDAKKLIWQSFNGSCILDQGKVKPVWESAKADIKYAFTLRNIVKGSFTWSKPRTPNIFRVYYIDGDNNWEKTFIELKNEDSIRDRGEIIIELNCWFINNESSARKKAQFIKDKAETLDFTCNLTGFSSAGHLEIYDRVTVTHPMAGWEAKDFIVKSITEDAFGRPALFLEAFYAGIYHGEPAVEQSSYASTLSKEFSTPPHVSSVTVAQQSYIWATNGNYIPILKVTYSLPYNRSIWKAANVYTSTDAITYDFFGKDDSRGTGFFINTINANVDAGSSIYIKAVSVSQLNVGASEATAPTIGLTVNLPNIQDALDSLPDPGTFIIPRGTYNLTSAVTVPDKKLTIYGADSFGVTIQNHAGSPAFIAYNLIKDFSFSDIDFKSTNTTAYSSMFNIYGDVATNNTGKKTIDNCEFYLADDGAIGGSGDIAVSGSVGGGELDSVDYLAGAIVINESKVTGGQIAFNIYDYKTQISYNILNHQRVSGVSISGSSRTIVNTNTIKNFYKTGINIYNCSEDNVLLASNRITANSGITDVIGLSVYGIRAENFGGVLSDNTITINTSITNREVYGIYCNRGPTGELNAFYSNKINIDVSTVSKTYGMYLKNINEKSGFMNNNVILDNDTAYGGATGHIGYYLEACSNFKVAESNKVNMINSAADDIGLIATSGCSYISGNIPYINCGTKIIDYGVSNSLYMIPGQITVAPDYSGGDFSSVSSAIEAITTANSKVFIRNGEYTLTDPVWLQDINTTIIGESQGGILIKNNPSSNAFIFYNLTKNYSLSNFGVSSQNTSTYSNMIYIYGDTTAQNSTKIEINNINIKLANISSAEGAAGLLASGDIGIRGNKAKDSDANININNCLLTGGQYGIYSYDDYNATWLVNNNIFTDNINPVFIAGVSSGIIFNSNQGINFKYIGFSVYAKELIATNNKVSIKSGLSGATPPSWKTGMQLGGGIEKSIINSNIVYMNCGILNTSPFIRGFNIDAPKGQVNSNNIYITVGTTQACYGIYSSGNETILNSNNIYLNNTNTAALHYGIFADSISQNIINTNIINLINSSTTDIGIYLDSSSFNNQGNDNITYNCGISILDDGSGNSITAKNI